jgi:hypothetical protein
MTKLSDNSLIIGFSFLVGHNNIRLHGLTLMILWRSPDTYATCWRFWIKCPILAMKGVRMRHVCVCVCVRAMIFATWVFSRGKMYIITYLRNHKLKYAGHMSCQVMPCYMLYEEIVTASGLTWLNVSVWNDPFKMVLQGKKLRSCSLKYDRNTNKILEYWKAVIRSLLAGLVGHSRKELKCHINVLTCVLQLCFH